MSGGQPSGVIPPAGTYPTSQPRPFTSMGDAGPGRRPSGTGRQAFGSSQGYPSHLNGPDSTGYPGGFNSEIVPRIQTPKPPLQDKPSPLDIGFEAPDPRPKSSKTAPPGGAIAAPPSTSGRPGTAQGSHGSLTKKLPGPQHGSTQGNPGFFNLPDGPSSPPQTPVQVPRPATTETPPKPASTPLPKPPGKGPKTFEEMGVPPGPKNEQDCVSILVIFVANYYRTSC